MRSGQIASRQLATDAAIIDAVLSRSPASVLDIGCGEGWLAGWRGRGRRGTSGLLTLAGCCIVQTLHPLQACGEVPYADGWREGSWQGFSSSFRSPPPWYFRTLETGQDCLPAPDCACAKYANHSTRAPANRLR